MSLNNLPADGTARRRERLLYRETRLRSQPRGAVHSTRALQRRNVRTAHTPWGRKPPATHQTEPTANRYPVVPVFSRRGSDVNKAGVPVTNNQANVTLTGLVADGKPVNMLITFTENDACAFRRVRRLDSSRTCPCSMDLGSGRTSGVCT